MTDPREIFQQALSLHERGRLADAEAGYRGILAGNPQSFGANYLLGVLCLQTGRAADGIALIRRAIAINPHEASAHNDLGDALAAGRQFDEALTSFDRALALQPDFAEAHFNRGNLLIVLRRLDAALESYDRSIALQPNNAQGHLGRGNLLMSLRRYAEALESFEAAIAQGFSADHLFDSIAQAKLATCQWDGYDELKRQLLAGAEVGMAPSPMLVLAMVDDPAAQAKFARALVHRHYGPDDELPPLGPFQRHRKIRIGYFSADFHDHATANLMAGMFEQHDRERFELTAFSFGPDKFDSMRHRLKRSFDQFVDIRSLSDKDAALLARRLEIDIAVDLKGFSQDARPGIFARRAAPLQINFLGYPGTMGAPYIDYIIADKTLIPQEHQRYYAEKVVYLPGSYQPNDRRRTISERQFGRAEVGLPPAGFVFCCFNNNYKITPGQFGSWMRILQAVDGSVLWLLEDNAAAARNLRAEASKSGIDAARLIFAPRLPLPEHLARQRCADLFLDTLPFNAHTTASDALWAGLPVLTKIGTTFAGRVAASLLHAIGLPELITGSREAYEMEAIALANNPARLAALKRKLDANRLRTPLFDTEAFTRHLEAAFGAIYERHHAGLAPDHLRLVPMA